MLYSGVKNIIALISILGKGKAASKKIRKNFHLPPNGFYRRSLLNAFEPLKIMGFKRPTPPQIVRRGLFAFFGSFKKSETPSFSSEEATFRMENPCCTSSLRFSP